MKKFITVGLVCVISVAIIHAGGGASSRMQYNHENSDDEITYNEDLHFELIVNGETTSDNTDLHKAAFDGFLDDVIRLSTFRDVNSLNNLNQTPLHLAASKGHSAIVEHLITHGANLNLKDLEDRSSYYLATKNGFYITAALISTAPTYGGY